MPDVPVDGVALAVDELIAGAVAARPDLRAAQAQALAAVARVRSARGPAAVAVGGRIGGPHLTDGVDDPVDRTGGALTLSIPLFGGFSGAATSWPGPGPRPTRLPSGRAAPAARGLRDLRRAQRFLTATERVRTADELLASAAASEEVALGAATARAWATSWTCCRRSALWRRRAPSRVNARLDWFTSFWRGSPATRASWACAARTLWPGQPASRGDTDDGDEETTRARA
ncbi:MAG: TolC family protein [bacterium]|nr:TolC family protein [bacterium]